MTSRAYLVLGPESSGTRLVTRVLMAGGCRGSDEHQQPFDKTDGPVGPGPAVWRRSVPHDGGWPDIIGLLATLHQRGYEPVAVVVARHPIPTEVSQADGGQHQPNKANARFSIGAAWKWIFGHLSRVAADVVVVPYESLLAHPREAQSALWARLGLPGGVPVEINDQNEKRYKEAR